MWKYNKKAHTVGRFKESEECEGIWIYDNETIPVSGEVSWEHGKVVDGLFRVDIWVSEGDKQVAIPIVKQEQPHSLDIEDFNFDSKAYELYKKGEHPAFQSQEQQPIENEAINLLKEYEQWEADLISDNAMWWPYAEKDAISGKTYDKMLELQAKRNKILSQQLAEKDKIISELQKERPDRSILVPENDKKYFKKIWGDGDK